MVLHSIDKKSIYLAALKRKKDFKGGKNNTESPWEIAIVKTTSNLTDLQAFQQKEFSVNLLLFP